MICNNCKKEISETSKFCRFCGNEIIGKVEDSVIEETFSPAKQIVYAGFFIRLMAYIFDYSLIIFLFTALYIVIGENSYNELMKYETIITYLAFIAFNTFFLSTWSRTPGKALFGLTVLKEDTLENINTSVSIKRSLLQIISTLFFGIGYWNMKADFKKQTFHDKKAKTVVVRSKDNILLPVIITIIFSCVWLYSYYLGTNGN